MNPYDFAPVDFTRPPKRKSPLTHEKFRANAVSGHLTGTIATETPIFIKSGNTEQFIKNKAGQHIIPGTSLKGLFRCLVETIANGCFEKFDGGYTDKQRGRVNYGDKLPKAFRSCQDPNHACVACRIFGMLNGDKQFAGKAGFQDAVCDQPVRHEAVNTIALMGPKPHHDAFYLNGDRIAGRKFYFHHPLGIKTEKQKTAYNQRINPVGAGSEFVFSADFANLEMDEWSALLYAIVLEPSMRHKIGYAKPAGFGSVKIDVTSIQMIDYSRRYISTDRGVAEYADERLAQYVSKQIQPYIQNTTSRTLNELRRIWNWNPQDPTPYRYPTAVEKDWFQKNPKLPIGDTP